MLLFFLLCLSVTANAQLKVTISGANSTCLSNGTVTALVSGSSGTIKYILLDGTGTQVKQQNDNNVFTSLAAGTYQVSISDDVSTNVLSNKITITSSYVPLALSTTGITPMPQYSVYSCTPSTTEGYLYVYIQSGTGNGPYKVTLYNGTGTMLSDTLIIPAGTYFGVIKNLPNGTYKVSVTDACNSTVQSGSVTISYATTISYPSTITNLIYYTPNYTKSTGGCRQGFDFYTSFFNSYYSYKDTLYTFIEFPAGNHSDTSYMNGPNMHLKFPTALTPADINGKSYKVWVKDPCTSVWSSESYNFPDGSMYVSTSPSSTASINNCDSIIPFIRVSWPTSSTGSAAYHYCYNVRFQLVKNDAPGVILKDTTILPVQVLNDYNFYKPTSSGDYTVTLTDGSGYTETQVVTVKALAPQKLSFTTGTTYTDCSLTSMAYQSMAYGFLQNTTYPVTVRLLNTATFPNAETAYQPVQVLQAPVPLNSWVNLFDYIPVPFTNPTYPSPNFYDSVKYEVTWPGCSRKDTSIVTITAQKFRYKSAKFTGYSIAVGTGGCSANAANVTINYEVKDTTGANVSSYSDFILRQLPTGNNYTTSANGTYTFSNLAPGTYKFGVAPNLSGVIANWGTTYQTSTCEYWDTITVVVPKLNAPSIDVSKTYGIICAGQPANSGTLTIAAVGYGPFQYAIGPKGAGTFSANQSSNVFTNLTAGDYDIRLTDGCGSQVVQTVQVVNASDIAKIKISSVNNSLVACSNDNVTLQLSVVGTASNIVWTLPDNSTVNDVTSLSIPNFSAANAGTYGVAIQSSAGCPASTSVNLSLAQPFGLQVVTPSPICKGNTIDLTSSAITAGSNNIATWAAYTNATATTAVTNPATVSPAATTTYYIKGLSPDGCVAIKPITVTVNDKASLGTLAKPAAACSGTSLALTIPTVTTNGSPLNGAGKWYLNNVEFDPVTLVTTADNNKTLYYSVVTDCGTSQTNSVNITVNAANSLALQTAVGTDNQSICTGTTLTTTKYQLAGTAAGVSMTGTFPTGVSGNYSGGVYTISGTPTSVGTYNYTLTSTGGTCAPATISGTITVSGTPSIATTTLPATVCAGNPLALVDPVVTANGATVTDPHWELGAGTTRIDASTLMTYADNGKSLRYVITSTCGGPTITRTVGNITVKDVPVITITQPAPVCSGSTLSLPTPSITANGSNYTNAHWELDGVTVTTPITVTTADAGKMLTYVVTADCGGSVSSNKVAITVNPIPIVNDISNSVVCNNTATKAIGFSGNVSGATYTWTNSNTAIGLAASGTGDIPSFTAVNVGTAPVIATITVTPSANTCGGASKTFTITVNPTPTVNAVANKVICNNTATTVITFSGNVSGTTYTWTNDNISIGLAASGTGNLPSFTAVNAGSAPVTATITVTPSANTCDGSSKSFTITVNPTPVINDITNSVVCNNAATAAINFSGNVSGTTYTWTNSNTSIGLAASGTGNLPSFTAVNAGSAPVTATITVTPNANTCSGSSKSFTITVNPTPTVNDISNSVVCNNTATAAIGFSGNVSDATYTWTNSNTAIGLAASGTGDIPSFTGVNAGSAPVTATITVTPVANTCGGSSKSFTITINPTPAVNAITNKVVCNNAASTAISFSGNVSGTTYTWTNDNTSIGLAASGAGDIPSFTALNTGSAPVTATITVTPSANTCGGLSKTFTITVNPTPVVNTIANMAVCNGAATAAINVSSNVSNATYTWTNSNTAIGLAASGTGDIPSFTGVNAGSAPVTATITVTPVANTCGGPSKSFTITVNPTPTVNSISNTVVCNNAATAAIGFSGNVSGTTYTWANDNTSIGLAAGGAGDIPSFTAVNTGSAPAIATITVTPGANTCDGLSKTFTITVNPTPTVNVISGQTICNGAVTTRVQFDGAVANTIYSWINSNTTIGLPASGTGDVPAFTAINGGTTPVVATITVTPSANTCGGSSQSFTITVNPDAHLTLSAGNSSQVTNINMPVANVKYTVVNEKNVVVTGLPAGVTYNYSAGNVIISGTPTESGTFNYTVTATGDCGTHELTGIILVNPDSDIKLISDVGTDAQILCINKPIITITYQVDNATNITVTGLPDNVTYNISGGTVTLTGTPTISGKFNYEVIATGLANPATRGGTITVNPDLTLVHDKGSESQVVCINKSIAAITYNVANASDVTVTGLPSGVNYTVNTGVVTISGAPSKAGTFSYTVNAIGICNSPLSLAGTITVNPDATIALTSGSNNQTLCINNNITTIVYKTTNATNVTVSGLPAGVSGNFDPITGSFVISGVPTQSGTFNYAATATGICDPATLNGTITVSPDVKLTLSSANNDQTVNINDPIAGISYTIANESNAVVTGLPAGVTYNYSAGNIIISGTPTESGTFDYTVTAIGACKKAELTGSIIVNPDSDIKLISDKGTDAQILCVNNPIVTITYQVDNATNITVTGLPDNVTYNVNGSTVTITGTSTISGKFNYVVTATGLAKPATRGGSITVNPDVKLTHGTGSENQVLCINKAITAISYTAVNATNATVSDLPAGVNGNYDPSTGAIVISGAPIESGTFNYTVTATGLCLPAQLSGKIVVNPDATIALTSGSNNQTLCINNNIATITYNASNATNVTASGLPAGVNGNYDPTSRSFVISGAPTQSGTFNYTVTATGICAPASLKGNITINADATLKYSAGNDNQVVCINKVITAITYNAANATGVNVTGLPAGVNYDYNNGEITISGTPTVSGKFNYSVSATGICKSSPSLTGVIEIKPDVVIAATAGADKQTLCNHTAIIPVNYTTANANSATVSGLPAGVTYNYTGNTILISGVPTESGIFTYTVTATGDCEKAEVTGTLEVKVAPVITTTSIAPVCAPNTVNLTTGITNYDVNNYTYTFTDAGGVPVVNPLAVSVAGIYTVAAQNKTSNCAADPQTIQVVINPKPVLNMVTLTPGDVCAPATVNISSLIANYDAAKYIYSYTDQYGNVVPVPTAISTSGNYNITATDKVNDTHCSSLPVTVTVKVNPQPVVTLANNGNIALCGNAATVNLTGSITNYNTAKYNYIFTDASGNILSNVSSISLPGTYTVKAVDNGTGCSSDKMTLTLTRYALPTVVTTDPAFVYDPYTVDITTPATTVGSTSGLTFNYYNSSNQPISNAAAQQISGPGNYTYYIQGTTAQGCKSNTAPVHVVIKDRPVLNISSAEIMEGQTATLTISLPANVTIPDPVIIVLDADHTSSTIRTGDYTMPGSVTLPSGQSSVTFNVKTWDNNVLDLDRILDIQGINSIYKVTNGTVMIHDSTSLKPQNKVITIGSDTIYGKGTAAVSVRLPDGITASYPLTISVYPAGGTTISSSDYDMPVTVTISANNNSSKLNVTVKNTVNDDRILNIRGETLGFTVKDGSVYIRKSRINVIPLVSDNGDGINDYLKIENIDKYVNKTGTGGNKVILFNRWEDVIYEADNYDNAAIKFDGRGNKRGSGRVPDGVYFYVITIEVPDNDLAPGEAKKQTFKGYFRLQK